MRHVLRALLAGGLGLAVSFLVACGGGAGLLTADQANSLSSQLDQVSAAIDAGQCDAAARAAAGFSNAVQSLPSTVNRTLTLNLRQGAATVGQLTAQDCRNRSTSTPTTPTTSTASTATATTTATTTQNTTTSSNTTPPPTTPPATTTVPSGTTSTSTNSGGAGLGAGGSGGAGTGNGNGSGR